MRKSFKFKLYNSKRNKNLDEMIGIAGWVFNWCVAKEKESYKNGAGYRGKFENNVELTQVKKEHVFIKKLGSQAVQEISERVHNSYIAFFNYVKTKQGPKRRPPKFKKHYHSFTLKHAGWKLLDHGRIRIGKVFYKFFQSREIEGEIKTVTIKKDRVGDYWVIFSTEVVDQGIQFTARNAVGIDLGVKTFATLSDGVTIEAPQPFKKMLRQIKTLNRSLSRKKKGSHNREEARIKLAKLHRKIADTRRDWHFKLANWLLDRYDVLCFETLNFRAWKALWGRKVSDYGFHQFITILRYLASVRGKIVLFCGLWFPSSKLCFECGWKNSDLCLRDREWNCQECGCVHNRDHNASKNILVESVRAFTDTLADVRLELSSDLCLTVESHML